MSPIPVWFKTKIENPKYSPYSSAHPRWVEFSGRGQLVHIDLSNPQQCVVVCNKTGKFLNMYLEEIHKPTRLEQRDFLQAEDGSF